MFDTEFFVNRRLFPVHKDIKRIVMVRRYFCKRGRYMGSYDWLLLYKAIHDFKLIFRFKYNMATKLLTADYIPRPYRWLNQMRFFQFYLKLFSRFKWHQLPLRDIFAFVAKAKRGCYHGLITQKNKKGKCF